VLDLQLPSEEVQVYLDSTRMSQVLINLAQNAARFTTRGSVAFVCTYTRKEAEAGHDRDDGSRAANGAAGGAPGMGVLSVWVRDTGSGLSDKAQQTILTTVQPSSGVDVGCGIGLYLVQKLLVSMGTKLSFSSPWTEQHAGTEFTFSLEVREGLPPPPPPTPPTAAVSEPRKESILSLAEPLHVLISDDLKANRLLILLTLKKIIRPLIRSVEACTAEEAIHAAAEQHFDLIFMDETYSAEEGALLGTDAVREIREAEAANPSGRSVIVCCTGYAGDGSDPESQHVNARFIDAGCDAVWGKPLPSHVDGSMQRELAGLLQRAGVRVEMD